MPWPVYLAFKQLFPTGRVSFFTLISVLGVGLGVALMLVSTSVMGGFGHQIERMIVDTQGEVQVRARGLINPSEAFEKIITDVPGVAKIAPYAQGIVMMEHADHPGLPLIQGYDLARVKQVIPIEKYIVAGSLDDLDDDSVILSTLLAGALNARIGDTVSVYSPLMIKRAKQDEMLLPREVRVAGIFRIGHQQLDSSTVIAPLRLMQDLYGLGREVHGYNVRLKPGANPDQVAAALNAVLPPGVEAQTWFESNADFQAVLSFERNMIFFLLTFIIIVAAFSITSSLLVTVVRKTREIGLLGAMGGKAGAVAASFCVQGLFIGVAGTVVGLAGGFALLNFRNAIVHVIAKATMGQEVFEKFYQFSSLPAYTATKDVVLIIVFSVIASTLAGLIPAWRAARLKPVEALRSGDATPVLRASGLRKTYPSGDKTLGVLDNVSLTVAAGESVSIRGESGSGKSTLLNLLAGLDRPDAGELFWGNEAAHNLTLGELTARRGRFLGMVFQAYYLIPEIDAFANVLMAARLVGSAGAAERARATALLQRVGLAERAHHLPAQLSGGERQRVAVARALMNHPPVLLADEPTGNLDEASGESIIDLLLGVCAEEKAALVLVTHNPAHAGKMARHFFLQAGVLR